MYASADSRVLVIGYGSTLRGDDAVGRRVADAIGQQGRPQVEVVSVTQLLPEFAGPVANARAVIFVDACCDDNVKTTNVRELRTEPNSAGQTHYAGPADILRLSQACYGFVPPAWLVSVPAKWFEIAESLSAAARDNAEMAVRMVGKLIDEVLCGGKYAIPPLPLEEGRSEGESAKGKAHSPCPLPEGEGSTTLVCFTTPVREAHHA